MDDVEEEEYRVSGFELREDDDWGWDEIGGGGSGERGLDSGLQW